MIGRRLTYAFLSLAFILTVPFFGVWSKQALLAYGHGAFSGDQAAVQLVDAAKARRAYLFNEKDIVLYDLNPSGTCLPPGTIKDLDAESLLWFAERQLQESRYEAARLHAVDAQFSPAQSTALTACIEASLISDWCREMALDVYEDAALDQAAGSPDRDEFCRALRLLRDAT